MVIAAQPRRVQNAIDSIWTTLAAIPDPEIPVISIVELGIVRDIEFDNGEVVVTVTPTYSGCPATEVIAAEIECALAACGLERFRVQTRLHPAWSTDWIAPAARERLRAFGIAPPGERAPQQTVDVSRLRRSCMSPLRLVTHPRVVALRIDAVQGAISMRGLPRAFRLLQTALTAIRD